MDLALTKSEPRCIFTCIWLLTHISAMNRWRWLEIVAFAYVITPELMSITLIQLVMVAEECRKLLGSIVSEALHRQRLAAR